MKPSFLSLLLCAAVLPAHASNVVVSNLGSAGGGSTVLASSSGTPLQPGSLVCLGTFPGLAAAAIRELAEQGPAQLGTALVSFGASSSIGTGAQGTPGTIEFTANQATPAGEEELYAVVLNGSTAGASTESLVLKLGNTVPIDDASGLPGYLAVHLRHAEVVFGSATDSGFATAAAAGEPTGYDAWITATLGAGASPDDLLPDADADGDGLSNFTEYAFGSEANSGASLAQVEIIEVEGQLHARYLRRAGDPSLLTICEIASSLGGDDWQELLTPVTVVPESVAPEGYERVQQALPEDQGGKLFARLRAGNKMR